MSKHSKKRTYPGIKPVDHQAGFLIACMVASISASDMTSRAVISKSSSVKGMSSNEACGKLVDMSIAWVVLLPGI